MCLNVMGTLQRTHSKYNTLVEKAYSNERVIKNMTTTFIPRTEQVTVALMLSVWIRHVVRISDGLQITYVVRISVGLPTNLTKVSRGFH
jgi:hypothetical protein